MGIAPMILVVRPDRMTLQSEVVLGFSFHNAKRESVPVRKCLHNMADRLVQTRHK